MRIILIIIILASFLAAIYHFYTRIFQKKRGAAILKYSVEPIQGFSFPDSGSLKAWEEKIFKGKVAYDIEKDGDLAYVKAKSDKAASALYYRISVDAKKRYPVITWKWRAKEFPTKKFEESLNKENEDDFAARFYVIFPAMFITNYKVLEYVWAEKLSPDTIGTSPYSKNIKLMVLRTGVDKNNEWFTEERDIVSDYTRMFGTPPEANIGAIAFMTNAEHTLSSAEALYDEIVVGYKKELDKTGGQKP
jgi:hypothetical protein